MLPARIAKNNRGLPKSPHGSQLAPVGLVMIVTRKPVDSRSAIQYRHGETRMIDIGVPADKDDVDGIPTSGADFLRGWWARTSEHRNGGWVFGQT